MPSKKIEQKEYMNAKKAVLLLKTVREGILTEKALLKKGFQVKKVAPPPDFRKGCEIAVQINLCDKEEIVKTLKLYNIENQGIVPLE
jgi:hypothetical protein